MILRNRIDDKTVYQGYPDMKVIFERILKEMRLSTQEKITETYSAGYFYAERGHFWSSKVIVSKTVTLNLLRWHKKHNLIVKKTTYTPLPSNKYHSSCRVCQRVNL